KCVPAGRRYRKGSGELRPSRRALGALGASRPTPRACPPMALMKEPPFEVPWPPGHGHTYTVQDGDDWGSVALRDGWSAWELIHFNFGIDGKTDKDLESRYVNWCLQRYVGCVDETMPDRKNYRFSSAAKPGVIYTKTKLKGEDFEDHLPFRVHRAFWPILQEGDWDCWATMAAIMMSYRNG